MSNTTETPRRTDAPNAYGIDPDDREQLLLDDLWIEQKRTREAVERRNDLLEELLARIDAADTGDRP
jgi:hypothetical protein